MRKLAKIVGLTLAVAATVFAGGCGEAKTYQELKAEVTPLVEKNRNIYHPWREGVAKLTKDLDVFMKEKAEAEAKLNEMEALAREDKELTKDFLTFRADATEVFTVGEQDLKNYILWAEKDGYK